MENKELTAVMKKAKDYIDALTVNSKINVPARVVSDENIFFTWDNEKRTPSEKPYLFDWSYYNGVVMEGLYDIYQEDKNSGEVYRKYVDEYLDAMIVTASDGTKALSRNLAGYVDHHGADCYKTAALLVKAMADSRDYEEVAAKLYRDLTDTEHKNSLGDIIPLQYTEEALGFNYWHCWAGQKPPKYKLWLDGIYMLQPFIAHYAAHIGDEKQLELVNKRLDWVADNMLAPNGMYYHACNSKADVCAFHWTRAMGWYAMAMVDVMEVLPEKYIEKRKQALKLFTDGILKYQDEKTGLWANVADWKVTDTNRLEVSGTSMMVYTLLKGVRKGWLDSSYAKPAVKAFEGIVNEKLGTEGLADIYLKASANNTNNYEYPEYYMTDEGKGSGPFIMAYSEMLYVAKKQDGLS